MTKYRTQTHDAPEPHKSKAIKPGRVGENKIGVYDHGPNGALRLRGQVGHTATAMTAARFHSQLGSKLGTGPDGKQAWIAPASSKSNRMARAQKETLAASLRAAKGSNR
jgi:hypothetical protein